MNRILFFVSIFIAFSLTVHGEPKAGGVNTGEGSGWEEVEDSGEPYTITNAHGTFSYPLNARCTSDDGWVQAGPECLRVFIVNEFSGDESCTNGDTLIVYLHGDGSNGRSSDYMKRFARRVHDEADCNIGATILRPGYFGTNGEYSSGDDNGRRDNHTEYVVDVIAAGITKLKQRYNSKKIILVGHSGGAVISAIILDRYPNLARGALLRGCPCDLEAWRDSRSSSWLNSMSPIENAMNIPLDSIIVVQTGDDDTNTTSEFVEEYIKILADKGVDASQQIVQDEDHNTIGIAGFTNAIAELLEKI